MARHDQYSPRITAHLGELADDIIGLDHRWIIVIRLVDPR